MPVNAALLSQFAQPVRSPADYENALNQQDMAALHNQLMKYQVQGAAITNQKQQQLLELFNRIKSNQQGSAPGGITSGGAAPINALAGGGGQGAAPPNALAGGVPNVGGLSYNDVVALKLLGGPDMSADFKMGLEGVSHAPGSEVTDPRTGAVHTVMTLKPGQRLNPDGSVSYAPNFVASEAGLSGATKAAEAQAANDNTLVPENRLGPDGRPIAMTVGNLIRSLPGSAPTGAPANGLPNSLPIDQLSPDQQQLALSDMAKRGQDVSTMKVNGQPAFADIQSQLDAAKKAGPQAIAQLQAQVLPGILKIADPGVRKQALTGFMADLQSPVGSPLHAQQGAQAQSSPGFNGFAGPADIEAAKAKAAADVKLATDPGIKYATKTAEDAAEYKKTIDATVSGGQDLMRRVAESKDALSQFTPGMGSETKLNIARAAQAMGLPDSLVQKINGGDVAAKQEFQKLAAQTAMESLRQALTAGSGTASGRITQAEFAVFQKANPNIELDPRAIEKIYNFMEKGYQRSYAEQQGFYNHLSKGGDPTQWPAIWARQQDPTGTGQIGAPASKPGGFQYLGKVQQ